MNTRFVKHSLLRNEFLMNHRFNLRRQFLFNNNFNPMSLAITTPLVATNYRIYNVNSEPFIQKYYSLLPSQLE